MPTPTVDLRPRCTACGRLLAEKSARPWEIMCGRHGCKIMNFSPPEGQPLTQTSSRDPAG